MSDSKKETSVDRTTMVRYHVCAYAGRPGTYKTLKEARAEKRQLIDTYGDAWIIKETHESTTIITREKVS